MRANDLINEIDPSRSPWTQSGKHPGAMNREELEKELAVFDELRARGDHLSPRELAQKDSLHHYLDQTNEGGNSVEAFMAHVVDHAKEIQADNYRMTDSSYYEFTDEIDTDDEEFMSMPQVQAILKAIPHVDMENEEIKHAIDILASGKLLEDFDAEGLQGKALMQLYKDNEHNNHHSENNLLLAKAFGTPKEIKMVELIIAKNQKQGYTDTMDSEWMYHNINKPYYSKLVKGSLDETYGIAVGMNSKDKDEQNNKTKAQVKNKKPYAKTESIFDE